METSLSEKLLSEEQLLADGRILSLRVIDMPVLPFCGRDLSPRNSRHDVVAVAPYRSSGGLYWSSAVKQVL